MSHLTITSRTEGQVCAYRAKYIDGVMVAEKGGGEGKPVGIAGVRGTTIAIEDMFYNVLTRKNALKNLADEYNRILQVDNNSPLILFRLFLCCFHVSCGLSLLSLRIKPFLSLSRSSCGMRCISLTSHSAARSKGPTSWTCRRTRHPPPPLHCVLSSAMRSPTPSWNSTSTSPTHRIQIA